MNLRRGTSLAALALALAADLPAQEARVPLPPVAPGMRVRVESPATGGTMRGTITTLDRTSITVLPEDGPKVRVPLDGLRRLETSDGSRRNTRRGAWMGAVAGAGLSFLYEPAACPIGGGGGLECNKGAVAGVGAAAGAAIGSVVGFFFKSERWTVVPIDRTPTADAGRVRGLRVALRF